MQKVWLKIQASNLQWQIRLHDSAEGICFGQLRLAELRIYPEIVVVTPRLTG